MLGILLTKKQDLDVTEKKVLRMIWALYRKLASGATDESLNYTVYNWNACTNYKTGIFKKRVNINIIMDVNGFWVYLKY